MNLSHRQTSDTERSRAAPPMKWVQVFRPLVRPGALVLFMTAWLMMGQLLLLTFITYFYMNDGATLRELSDAYAASEVWMLGIMSGLFLYALNHLRVHPTPSPLLPSASEHLEQEWLSGLSIGGILGTLITGAFLWLGFYRQLGFLPGLEENWTPLLSLPLRGLGLFLMVYTDEQIFRGRILLKHLRDLPPWVAVLLTSILYTGLKAVIFKLGVMHITTLFLVSVLLSLRAVTTRSIAQGLASWAGFLLSIYVLFGLPILGSSASGFFFLQYHPDPGTDFAGIAYERIILFMTGGIGGPLSSAVFQVLLALALVIEVVRKKKRFSRATSPL